MVGSGYLVCNRVLEKQGFEKPFTEVLASVTDDGLGSTKSSKDVGLNEGESKQDKDCFFKQVQFYFWEDPELFKYYADQII